MKKSIVNICILVTVLVAVILVSKNKLDTSIVEKYMELLSSEEFVPREVWSESNEELIQCLEEDFKELKLEAIFNDGYLHQFGDRDKGENPSHNVVGKISGVDSSEAIVITAHFDAMKSVYDNGTGVAILMDIAVEMKRENDLPQIDIIFALTNGEERGMLGSKDLVEDLGKQYEEMYNVNIDCVGLKDLGEIALGNISAVKESDLLYDAMKKAFDESGVKWIDEPSNEVIYRVSKEGFGQSDYAYFNQNGYPNICIIQLGVTAEYAMNESYTIEDIDIKELKKISNGIIYFMSEFKR